MNLAWSRILSLLVGITYIVIVMFFDHLGLVILTLGYLVMPFGCIWFSEEIGGFTGIGANGISISSKTPGIFIEIIGWFLLFLPVIGAVIISLITVVK